MQVKNAQTGKIKQGKKFKIVYKDLYFFHSFSAVLERVISTYSCKPLDISRKKQLPYYLRSDLSNVNSYKSFPDHSSFLFWAESFFCGIICPLSNPIK